MPEEQFRRLDSEKIADKVGVLSRRILDQFPEAGLGQVSIELHKTASEAQNRADWIAQPILGLRIATYLLIGLIATVFILAILNFQLPEEVSFLDFIQALEAGMNDVILLGAGIFFLVTIETRIKRRQALRAIHELRSIAHIIDIHQLSKDPQQLLSPVLLSEAAPRTDLSLYELGQYLDYCSEMLSLSGKVAALYVQNFDDPVVLAAVNEIESLTSGLSRKIWQKLMLLHSFEIPENNRTNGPTTSGQTDELVHP